MRPVHRTVRDRDILGRAVHPPAVGILAGLDHNPVIAGIDVAIGDAHVAARIHIDPARVVTAEGFDHDTAYHRVIVVHQLDRPHGGTYDVYALDQHVLRFHQGNEHRQEFRRGLLVGLL